MEPIRVLHVVGNMDAGGLETLIMNWYRNIDRECVQFGFLTNTAKKGFYEDEILSMGGKIYHLSFMDDKNIAKYKKDLAVFFAEHREFSVVHGHHSALGPVYLKAAKKAGVPCRISHSHIASFSKTPRGIVKYLITRRYGACATHHFACSVAAGQYMYGKKTEFTVINNGIDTQCFAFSEEARAAKRAELDLCGKQVAVHVGRFHDQKNHAFLVDVFRGLCEEDADAVLLLIGVGPLEETIKTKVRELGLEGRVRFMGNRSDVNEILCAADVFVFPSLYEGLPLTLVEAQTSGVPVVCSTAVTDETRLTDGYEAVSLSEPVARWCEVIRTALSKTADRTAAYETVRQKKYDCRDIAHDMQAFYITQTTGAAAQSKAGEVVR